MVTAAYRQSQSVWRNVREEPRAGTSSAPVRDIALRAELRGALPSDSKVEWVIQALSVNDRAEVGSEFLRVGTRACRSGHLAELAELILSWEATAEEAEDIRTLPSVRSVAPPEKPVDLGELRRQLGVEG